MFRGDCELNSYATSHSLTSECLMRCWKWPPGHGIPLSGLLGVGAGLSPSRHFWARFRMLATALLMSFSERVSASSTTMSSISSIVSGRLPSSRHLSLMIFWTWDQYQKSSGFKSGDRDGQLTPPLFILSAFLDIMRVWNLLFSQLSTFLVVWHVAPSWKQAEVKVKLRISLIWEV